MKNNREVVLAACSTDGLALQYAAEQFKKDREVVLVACSKKANALYAVDHRRDFALKHAAESLRADKDVVMAATEFNPESLKFALGGLNQDEDCLVKANLWDKDYAKRDIRSRTRLKKIVLSTKFSLAADSSPHATRFTVALKKHPYIANGDFVVYSPNAFSKGTCDPNWTDEAWPCRGTYVSCRKPPSLKTGVPQEAFCCWRYSFRYHLEEAYGLGGFMIQVVDLDWRSGENTLGDGQRIETEMARDIGIKIFRFLEPKSAWNKALYAKEVDELVSKVVEWYKNGSSDREDCNFLTLTYG